MTDSTSTPAQDKVARVLEMYREGAPLDRITAETGASARSIARYTGEAGVRRKPPGGSKPVKRDRNIERVLALHVEGKNVSEIAGALNEPVHYRTIGTWLVDAGQKPLYPPEFTDPSAPRRGKPGRERHPRREEAVRRHVEGKESLRAIAADIGVNQGSVSRWVREDAGVGRRERTHSPERQKRAAELYGQGLGLDAIRQELHADYYVVRELLTAAGIDPTERDGRTSARRTSLAGNECPCGEDTGSKDRLYHSDVCRTQYGRKREADPENYVTFACDNDACRKTVTRRKSYGRGGARFCSNRCAQRHTRTVRHYVVREGDMVLDSGWEVLFAGLCAFLKVAVERTDRETAVELGPKSHYAPDFWLPTVGVWVEVKGLQDDGDEARWAAWREQRGPLAVVDREGMNVLRSSAGQAELERELRLLAQEQVEGKLIVHPTARRTS